MIKELPADKQRCLGLLATNIYGGSLLEHAILRMFVESYGPSMEESLQLRNLIDIVTEEIRKVFNASWLDFTSKIRALNKLTSIIPRVAYPLWIMNDTAFQAHHENLGQIEEADSYLKVIPQNWFYDKGHREKLCTYSLQSQPQLGSHPRVCP